MEAAEELRYTKHLYISLGKMVSAYTKEKPTTLLEEEFLYYTESRVPLMTEWIDRQIVFTRNRSENVVVIPSDIRILIGAWELLKSIVVSEQFQLLKLIWRIFSHFGIKDNEHDQYSWHLGAIIYHWIEEGISGGTIPPNPYRNPYVVMPENKIIIDDDDDGDMIRQGVCLQLKAIQCFLNFSAEDGNALLHHKVKKLNRPVYLFRLSATIPGAIVLQFIVPNQTKRHAVLNVRIGANTMGGDKYNFFMRPRDYTTASEAYILKYIALKQGDTVRSEMVHLQPTLKEMVGQTAGYVRYFNTKEKTMIPLESVY